MAVFNTFCNALLRHCFVYATKIWYFPIPDSARQAPVPTRYNEPASESPSHESPGPGLKIRSSARGFPRRIPTLFVRHLCRSERFEHIARITARGNPEQQVSGTADRLDSLRKNIVVTVIVRHAGNMCRIAQSHSRQRTPVTAETPGQLLGEMHGIAHRTAVTARDDLSAAAQRLHHQPAGLFQGFPCRPVVRKLLQQSRCGSYPSYS